MKLYLAEVRRKQGETQETLATLAGVHPNTVARIEIGYRSWSPSTLQQFALALGVNDYELLGYVHPPDALLPEPHQRLIKTIASLNGEAVDLLSAVAEVMVHRRMIRAGDPESSPAKPSRTRGRGRPRSDPKT